MSLDYDLTNVADHNWEITKQIIFGCMITDIGRITDANHEEWFARYKVILPDSMITLMDVQDHIGLRTNVVNKTRTQWCKGILNNHMMMILADAKRIAANMIDD